MNRRLQQIIVATSFCLVALLIFGTVKVRSASPDEPYVQLGVYSDVLTKIQVDYVEEPDLKKVTLGAINGMLESIDPFASYLNEDQYKQYTKEYKESGPGIGLLLSRGPGYLRVVNALPGSPADKAGLSTGDVLESINDISTRDMPLAFAQLLLQGKPGTEVKLSALMPQRGQDPVELTITRAEITFPPVSEKLETAETNKPVGVVGSVTLAKGRVEQIAKAIEDLQKQGATSIVLDLRNDAYGPTEEGVKLADLFMNDGMIVYTEGQNANRHNFTASKAKTVTDLPLVVLTNRATAGAAEIAAAALMESGRGTVIGEPTFGNAAIREAIKLEDGGAIILATAKYFSPEGKAIQDERVTPEVLEFQISAVQRPLDPDAAEVLPDAGAAPEKAPEDTILERTWEYINKGE